MKSSFS